MEFIIFIAKVLAVLAVFSVLIIVHEWGHYISARKIGIRVERFSIGFGKKIFSRKVHDTEFMVSAVPLGGYVKMAGDERQQCKGRRYEFYSHPVGHRVLVVLMGPLINFLFALLCFYLICVSGFPRWAPKIGNVDEQSPAHMAGLQKEDYIFAINGFEIESWKDIQKIVRESPVQELYLNIRRGNQILMKTVVPRLKTLQNEFGQEKEVPVIGIQPTGDIVLVSSGPLVSVVLAGQELIKIPVMTFKILFHIIVGDVPAEGNIGGPVLIVAIIWEAIRLGMAHVIYITAVISASLAVINLFPLPVLDGGHILFMAIEKIRGRPLSAKSEELLTKIGMAVLMLLMLFVLYNDISQLEIMKPVKEFVNRLWPGTR